jgi:hypothetical protein
MFERIEGIQIMAGKGKKAAASSQSWITRQVSRRRSSNNSFYELRKELLPGLPNNVTLMHIASKLPWGVCQALTKTSNDWRLVIQSCLVHNAAIRQGATKKYFLNQCHRSTHCAFVRRIRPLDYRSRVCFRKMCFLFIRLVRNAGLLFP